MKNTANFNLYSLRMNKLEQLQNKIEYLKKKHKYGHFICFPITLRHGFSSKCKPKLLENAKIKEKFSINSFILSNSNSTSKSTTSIQLCCYGQLHWLCNAVKNYKNSNLLALIIQLDQKACITNLGLRTIAISIDQSIYSAFTSQKIQNINPN